MLRYIQTRIVLPLLLCLMGFAYASQREAGATIYPETERSVAAIPGGGVSPFLDASVSHGFGSDSRQYCAERTSPRGGTHGRSLVLCSFLNDRIEGQCAIGGAMKNIRCGCQLMF
jgi:hypothetical protein